MKQNDFIKDFGHCCNACKYYDIMSGYCSKTNEYHHGCDFTYGDGESCPKWKIADDLKKLEQKKIINKINYFKKKERNSMKIMIKDQQWTIEDVWNLENCIGQVTYREQKIEILRGLPRETRRTTIIHELTHAVMWVYGFGQFESLSREQICDFIGCYGEEIMALTAKVLKEK